MDNLASILTPGPSPLNRVGTGTRHRLFVKRDDLLTITAEDPFCGNKWRKLKYNLIHARDLGHQKLLTFGGAFSNHIAATASAGAHLGFSTVGVIRGEPHPILNPTLASALAAGMQLDYLDRSTYRQKETPEVNEKLHHEHGPFYLIPEGGTNQLALQGCRELAAEIRDQLGFWPDYLCVSCGTGGTMAGLIEGVAGQCNVLGFSALKGNFHQADVQKMLPSFWGNWEVRTDYHFGGYAKYTSSLINFINDFKSRYGFRLDPVYTGKLFFGVFDLAERGYFPKGCSIVIIHTGGLQGIDGFNQRFGNLLK